MRPVIMRLDLLKKLGLVCGGSTGTTYMLEIGRVLESWHVPVKILHPAIDVGVVVANRTEVAFEVPMVDRVKPNLVKSGSNEPRV